jgi:hypothetical protein
MRRRVFPKLLAPLILATACSGDSDGATGAGSGGANGSADDGGALSSGEGGAGGGSGGASGGENAGSNGPVCQSLKRNAAKITPNILIVLDRSNSMAMDVAGETRWSGSVKAVRTVASELDDVIRFGLLTFPSGNRPSRFIYTVGSKPDMVGPLCGVDAVDVGVVDAASAKIDRALDGRVPGGMTPTARALALVRKALQAGATDDPDAKDYVLLVTDGAPNCSEAYVSSLEACEQAIAAGSDKCVKALPQEPESDIEATVAAIASLAKDDIQTFVVGFQTEGVANLDRMAKAGGTGDATHRSVETGAELLDTLREITGIAASCAFKLDQPISDPEYVSVKVDGEPQRYGTDWSLDGDMQTITILGEACDALQTGAGVVEVSVECEPVVVL